MAALRPWPEFAQWEQNISLGLDDVPFYSSVAVQPQPAIVASWRWFTFSLTLFIWFLQKVLHLIQHLLVQREFTLECNNSHLNINDPSVRSTRVGFHHFCSATTYNPPAPFPMEKKLSQSTYTIPRGSRGLVA